MTCFFTKVVDPFSSDLIRKTFRLETSVETSAADFDPGLSAVAIFI